MRGKALGRSTTLVTLILLLTISIVSVSHAAKPVTITVAGWASEETFNPVIDAFKEQHPNVEVEYQRRGFSEHHDKLVVEMAAGVAPDVFLLSWAYFGDFVVPGSLLSLDQYIERDKDEVRPEQYFPPALADSQYHGKQYGLPWLLGGQAMWYNIDLLSEVGLSEPKSDWTWQEWLEMARRTTRDPNGDGKRDTFGFNDWDDYEMWAGMIFSHGGSMFNADQTEFTIDTEPARKTFRFISDLVNQSRVVPSKGERASFHDGTQAFGLKPPTHIAGTMDTSFEWSITAPPKGDVKQVMTGGNLPLVIWSKSTHKEEAWEFIKFSASPKMQAARADMGYSPPGRRDAYPLVENKKMLLYSNLIMYQVPFTNMLYNEINDAMRKHLRSAVNKEEGIDSAITNANSYLNAVLQDWLKR